MSDSLSIAELGMDQQQLIPSPRVPEGQIIEHAAPRSDILLERLNELGKKNNGEYNPENISNIWRFIHQTKLVEEKRMRFVVWSKYFKEIDDFKIYFQINPEWQGRSRKNLEKSKDDGGAAFIDNYRGFLRNYFRDPATGVIDIDKVREEVEKLIPSQKFFWSSFATSEDFVNYYNSKPEWQGKSRADIEKLRGSGDGGSFMTAYRLFLNEQFRDPETGEVDKNKVKEKLDELIPARHFDWSDFKSGEDFVNYYNSKPEWQGTTRSQLMQRMDGGNAFIQAYRLFLNEQFRDPATGEINSDKVKEKLEEISPILQSNWTNLKTIEDYREYYNAHPEWHDKIQWEMLRSLDDGGSRFINSYRRFLTLKYMDPETGKVDNKKVIDGIRELIPLRRNDWSRFTEEDFVNYYNSKPEWQGKSKEDMENSVEDGGYKFMGAYLRYLYKRFRDPVSGKVDLVEVRKKRDELIPPSGYRKAYEFENGNKIIFDSTPERLIAILLNKYGFLDNPQERENVHVRVGKATQHSIDFLVGNSFIEYHPLSVSDRRQKLSLDEAANNKKNSITVDEYQGHAFYHIWNINQLYEVIIELSHNKKDSIKDLSIEEFKKRLADAYQLAYKYDLANPEQTKKLNRGINKTSD